ncbi:MAG: 5-formyltetrahydrofolate cyclo-ligase [Nitrososphaerota archaeon]
MAKGVEEKAHLREKVWQLLRESGVALPPFPLEGRIPNFRGAAKACERVSGLQAFQRARVVKVNPDSPQRHIRYLALTLGKSVLMPTPRLRQGFLLIPPLASAQAAAASTISGAFRYGRRVPLREVPKVDLVILGAVAVNERGARLGKGGGYADLEYALLREAGRLSEATPIVAVVHDLQVLAEEIPMLPHDVPVDVIVTPSRIMAVEPSHPKPKGVLRELAGGELKALLAEEGLP